MSEHEKSKEHKHFLQASLMFAGISMVLNEIAPERTKEMLEAVLKKCDEEGYGTDIPRVALNRLLAEKDQH